MSRSTNRDRGTVLVLTLILTVVLAVVVVAIASFVSVGLRTSDTTDLRSETNADGAAIVTWAMEQLRLGNLDVGVNCPSGGAAVDLSAAGSIAANGSSVTLECSSGTQIGTFPVVTLSAVATKDSVRREVLAVAQVAPPPDAAVRALDWSVDDVPLGP